ncbi:nucleoredoxin-like protein 2 isoform X1 [Dermacentor albipictus]|uniref:nucleoredoxin-like protein 2 isoform X1 n=1 Tax=Dermacentor albipictus TaxID=60249 RepID=UPI0031FDB982
MELFRGKTLLRKDGSLLAADDVLSEVRVLALYFSAGWCPACRMFTPVLADAYRHTKNHKVEVVFVSSDSSIFAMLRHMRQSHANWYAVEYGDPLRQELLVKYDVTGIPALVVVKKDGSVVNPDARVDVTTKGHQAFLDWLAFS